MSEFWRTASWRRAPAGPGSQATDGDHPSYGSVRRKTGGRNNGRSGRSRRGHGGARGSRVGSHSYFGVRPIDSALDGMSVDCSEGDVDLFPPVSITSPV